MWGGGELVIVSLRSYRLIYFYCHFIALCDSIDCQPSSLTLNLMSVPASLWHASV